LKDRRPRQKPNGAYQKTQPAGGRFPPPAGASAIRWPPGVIRCYPSVRDPDRDPPRHAASSRRSGCRPWGEVHSSRATGSWES